MLELGQGLLGQGLDRLEILVADHRTVGVQGLLAFLGGLADLLQQLGELLVFRLLLTLHRRYPFALATASSQRFRLTS